MLFFLQDKIVNTKKGNCLQFYSRICDFEDSNVVIPKTHPVTSLRENKRKQTLAGLTEAKKHCFQAVCFFWRSSQRGAVQIFVRLKENKPRNSEPLSRSQRSTDNIYEKNNKHYHTVP